MRRWPDLQHRAEIAARKKSAEPPEVAEGKNAGIAAAAEGPKLGEVLRKLLENVISETVSAGSEMTEDAFVSHLKDCAACRRNVASFARMGMKIPSKILVAAGVEVLN